MLVTEVDDLRLMEMGIIPGVEINAKKTLNHYIITYDNTILVICDELFKKIK